MGKAVRSKLHHKIFFLLLLFLPTQLGRHFWPDFSFVFGLRVDYLAPTLFFTDVLFLALMIFWAKDKLGEKYRTAFNGKVTLVACAFFLYFLMNTVLVADNTGAALYKLVKIFEVSALGFYTYQNRIAIVKSRFFHKALLAAIFYVSIIAVSQFILQKSIGGIFWFLGERSFSSADPGIALVKLGGQNFLRPCSTFSHPNSLAGFLLVALVLVSWGKTFWHKTVFLLGTATLFLSFSRTAFLAALLLFVVRITWKTLAGRRFRPAFILGLLVAASFLPILLSETLAYPTEEVLLRRSLITSSAEMIARSPIFGIGLNNFIYLLPLFGESPTISWFLQPVHNIYLLFAAEAGLVAAALVFWILFGLLQTALRNKKSFSSPYTLAFLAALFTGTLDHYWLTLQQNQLLLGIVVGLLLANPKKLS